VSSLEKFMLFVPNRLYVAGCDMHVSFNIAVIPPDVTVTSMTLRIPLPPASGPFQLECREVAGGWDEQSVASAPPPTLDAFSSIHLAPGVPEAEIGLAFLADAWRFRSLENHGVFVRLHGGSVQAFAIENPPYLIVGTD